MSIIKGNLADFGDKFDYRNEINLYNINIYKRVASRANFIKFFFK